MPRWTDLIIQGASEYPSEEAARQAAYGDSKTVYKIGYTPSMLGTFKSNSFISLTQQPEYSVGDVVTFRSIRGPHITHRVTATKPGHVFLKGDFNERPDGWVPLDRVVGKVTGIHGWGN